MVGHKDVAGRHYRADIDGLRAISILGVLGFHAIPGVVPGGFVGVDVFFVISGYLISGLIFTEIEEARFRFSHFYGRRIRRIFPALIAVLVVTCLIGWFVLFADEFRQLGKHMVGSALFVSNFVLLAEAGYFDALASTKPLLHLWSLAIEEQFYVVWPLFCWVLFRRRRLFLAVTLAFWLVSFLSMVWFDSRTVAFFSPVARFWELLSGALLAYASREPLRLDDRAKEAAGWVGLVLLVVAIFTTPEGLFPGWRVLLPVGGTCLLIVAGPRAWLSRLVLSCRPMVFVGLISYPLYLWHWPLLSYASIVSGGAAETQHGAGVHGFGVSAQTRLILLATSFGLAYLSYELIEKPVRFGRRRELKAFGALGLMAVMGVVGGAIVANQGVTTRFAAQSNLHLSDDLRIPTDTRSANGSCQRLLSVSVQGDTVCLANSAKPTVMIVGDSQAMALHSSIYMDMVKLPTVLLAANSYLYEHPTCLKDGDFSSWLKGNEPCQQVARNALSIADQVPSIATVIVLYQRDSPFYLDRQKIEHMQSAFLRAGKQVVYFLSTPGFWAPITACQPRKVDVLGVDLSPETASGNCQQARWTFSEYQDEQRRYIDSLRHGDPNTFIFDQLPAFCDPQFCYQAGPDGLWFWTLQHVNEKGSVRVLNEFLGWARKNLRSFSG
jgi:peptidoglycan/LPS O-acetylase OafA/YrhL